MAVRAVALIIPIAVAWLAVRLLGPSFVRPGGWAGAVLWFLQAVLVATVVSAITDRGTRRLLPLATLLDLALVFPDRAPSRFGIALRAGSTKRLRARLDELAGDGLGTDVESAANRALELVGALARHDRLTRGHTERVRAHADLIAQELGMSESDRLHLAWGVLLHDVGKMAVPPEILNKEEPLTDAEWRVLSRHPEAGRELVVPLEGWLGDWLRPVHEHHERWDGGGYPVGLAGTDISLGGRIVAVADAYDVITAKRSYKEPMSPEAARREIVRCAGTQFDPEVVRAFVATAMGRRWAGGAFAPLSELPSLSQLGSSVGGAATGVVAAGTTAAVLAGAGPISEPLSASAAVVEASPTTTVVVETTTTTTVPPTTGPIVLRSPSTTEPTSAPDTTATSSTTTTTSSPMTTTTTSPPSTTSEPAGTTTPPTLGPTTTSTTPPPSSTTPPPSLTTTTSTTPPSTTSTTVPTTTTTAVAVPLACEVQILNQWEEGYRARIRLRNTGETRIVGWTLTWRFDDDAELESMSGASLVSDDDAIVVGALWWNDEVQPGGVVVIVFTAETDGEPATPPSDLTANGAPCA